jgi:spore maturation protein SpmA/spore maturation protein SpmB
VLNGIFVFIALVSILLAGYTGHMDELTQGILTDAKSAVELSIGLIGVMAFFLGLMKVAQDGGLLRTVARAVAPLMRRLFPSVPEGHPAMEAMILNISSNMLGLANAATPFGIKAMEQLNKLNSRTGTATNDMVLFLAINTAGLAILPSGVVGLRASLGSQDAYGIFFPTWFASGSATVVGITAAFLLSRLPRYRRTAPPPLDAVEPADAPADAAPDRGDPEVDRRPASPSKRAVVVGFWLAFFTILAVHVVKSVQTTPWPDVVRGVMSFWVLAALVGGLILFGWSRGVKVYESLVEGAKDGWQVAKRIIPYLVAILVAVGMLRHSGGIDLIVNNLGPWTGRVGLPAEALPMALLRPLSGSGAFGIMAEIMNTHGPDSFIGYMVSTFQGSTETTFYVLAVYFGAVGVKETRHALPACLLADTAGIIAAVFIVNVFFG